MPQYEHSGNLHAKAVKLSFIVEAMKIKWKNQEEKTADQDWCADKYL